MEASEAPVGSNERDFEISSQFAELEASIEYLRNI